VVQTKSKSPPQSVLCPERFKSASLHCGKLMGKCFQIKSQCFPIKTQYNSSKSLFIEKHCMMASFGVKYFHLKIIPIVHTRTSSKV